MKLGGSQNLIRYFFLLYMKIFLYICKELLVYFSFLKKSLQNRSNILVFPTNESPIITILNESFIDDISIWSDFSSSISNSFEDDFIFEKYTILSILYMLILIFL